MALQVMISIMIKQKEGYDHLTWNFNSIMKPTLAFITGTAFNHYAVLPIWFQTGDVGCALFKEVLSDENCCTVREIIAQTIHGIIYYGHIGYN